jgi:hypothetical protein
VATPGKIERASLKPTVLPSTQLATPGARNGPARGFGNEGQTSIALDNDQDDAPVLTLPPRGMTIGTNLDAHASAISRQPEEA